jgi:hypothetical protein
VLNHILAGTKQKIMKQALKSNPKTSGIAKPQAPEVKTIPVPQPKKEETVKPTLESRIQKVEEL